MKFRNSRAHTADCNQKSPGSCRTAAGDLGWGSRKAGGFHQGLLRLRVLSYRHTPLRFWGDPPAISTPR